MKKKLSLMLCLCFMVLAMTACGTDPAAVDYYGMSYSEMKTSMEQEVSALVNLSDENRAYIESYGSKTTNKVVALWDEIIADLGAYQGLGQFNITQANDTVTVEQVAKFADRDVNVTYVYSFNYETEGIELTDASVDLVYSLGEKMSKAGINTLMGMGTVFSVLILISLIIFAFNIIPYLQKKKDKRSVNSEETKKAVVTQIEQREEQQLTDDLELVAVISAAIAASTGTSVDGFVVRSIHRR